MKNLDVSFPRTVAERRLREPAGQLTLDELAQQISTIIMLNDPVSVRDNVQHSRVWLRGTVQLEPAYLSKLT